MKNIKSPVPFFDTINDFKNPYRNPVKSITHLHENPPADALSDYQVASEFLYSYRGSNDTFSTYRRELEHFLHWSWIISGKSLKNVRREDIESYVEFARNPPANWIGNKNVSRFIEKQGERIPNPAWKPYVVIDSSTSGITLNKPASTANDTNLTSDIIKDTAIDANTDTIKSTAIDTTHDRYIDSIQDGNQLQAEYFLSQNALQSLFAVLSSFYNFLVQEEYTEMNPVAQIRQKSKFLRKSQSSKPIRRLSQLQWSYVIDSAEELAHQDPARYERTLFIMNALFAMYLRISELVVTDRWTPTMGDFERDIEGNWWFRTVGKGNKERQVSVSDNMLAALRRYRVFRGLPPLPAPGENTPLVHKERGRGGITSTRQIRGIVQKCFDQAMHKMMADGFEEEARQLSAATVHWLRHTGISEDVKHRPREHVRDDAGHGSSAITDRYIDVELHERHASGRKKTIKPS